MKDNIKELLGMVIFMIINICIAYGITTPFGVQNTILYQSMSAMGYIISYEIIIWFILSFIEAFIYEKIAQKNSEAF